MAVSDLNAIGGLTTLVAGLTARTPPEALQPLIEVRPERIVPTGLGGYVSERKLVVDGEPIHDELFGCRIDGDVVVTARDQTAAGLDAEVDRVRTALLKPDRATRLEAGLQRLMFKQTAPPREQDSLHVRELTFDVIYELVRVPEDQEVHEIAEIERDISLS